MEYPDVFLSWYSNILFDDLFNVDAVDRDGKKFDRVSRVMAKSTNHEMELTLDINTDLWPLRTGDSFSFALASNLQQGDDAAAKDQAPTWRLDANKSMGLADDYEYVMYGKVYKFDGAAAERVTAYASFGGLLMALTGAYNLMERITVGDNIYLLARR